MSVGNKGTNGGEPCREWAEAIRDAVLGIADGGEDLKAHLAACPRCRLREAELRGVAGNLGMLAQSRVEPSAEFHAKWVEAVIAEQPADLAAAATAVFRQRSADRGGTIFLSLQVWRDFLRAQLRPAMVLLPVWVLILLFRISTPEPGNAGSVSTAESPFKILQAFITQHEFGSPLEEKEAE